MKKLYSLLLTLAVLVCCATAGQAQNTTGRTYVGYAQFSDQIWEYDGLSLDHNAKVGCAILLTREMLEPYIGGTIVGMRAGWDTSLETGTYTGFVRATFNGDDLTTSKATTVRYNYSSSNPGWNDLTLTSYEIPEDVEQLVVGFTTTLKKDVCAIPMLYPKGVENSCFLWVDGDNDAEGKPIWRDMHDVPDQYGTSHGMLPILLTIRDSKGTFNYLPTITMLTHNGVVPTEEASDCLVRIKNLGSQPINSIEVTSRQGEQVYSQKVNLSSAIAVGRTSSQCLIPLWCFHSGDLELSITKANNQEIAKPEVQQLNVIGVPRAVEEAYIRRPLVEYYESENNYMSARYYDDYVAPSLKGREQDITFVCQHLDDQFMTGEDDATVLSLRLCDNDSSQISIPSMTIDRAMGTENYLIQSGATKSPMFPVYTTDGQLLFNQTMNGALQRPTFLNIEVSGAIEEDGQTLQVKVGGDIASGIMPEGEQPRLTVYLMERNVHTDSQIFWTEKEKEEYQGEYVHANVIREVLTDSKGDAINAEGEISSTYTTELLDDWKKGDLYLVAFVHRDGNRGGKFMHVFNSAEGNINFDADGIDEVSAKSNVQSEVYDLTGRRVGKPSKGIFIKNGKKVIVR
ncbi:MAG: Omp28-related outer membrane protein [Bacteroidaceae bacterium]|nr:Omp28-related outer membrane protein [Bacteroidaceae bacterium]